jgi:hypothetical protein
VLNNELFLVLFIWNAFYTVGELEGRADFLEEDFSGRLIKNSWRELDQRLTVEE